MMILELRKEFAPVSMNTVGMSRRVNSASSAVLLQVAELHTSVPALLAELTRQNVSLTELRTHSATLEDVFVNLTGRHLRDE